MKIEIETKELLEFLDGFAEFINVVVDETKKDMSREKEESKKKGVKKWNLYNQKEVKNDDNKNRVWGRIGKFMSFKDG